jgi:hypothetical protein
MPGKRPAGTPASSLIDARIEELGDWRGRTLARVRALVRKAAPAVVEEWKWRGVPVWSHAGILCTGETYAKIVKLTFARGAALDDPFHLFNTSLEGTTRRAIDIREGEAIDERALVALVRAAVALNESRSTGAKGPRPGRRAAAARNPRSRPPSPPASRRDRGPRGSRAPRRG